MSCAHLSSVRVLLAVQLVLSIGCWRGDGGSYCIRSLSFSVLADGRPPKESLKVSVLHGVGTESRVDPSMRVQLDVLSTSSRKWQTRQTSADGTVTIPLLVGGPTANDKLCLLRIESSQDVAYSVMPMTLGVPVLIGRFTAAFQDIGPPIPEDKYRETEPLPAEQARNSANANPQRRDALKFGRARFPTTMCVNVGYAVNDTATATSAFVKAVAENEDKQIEFVNIRASGSGWLANGFVRSANGWRRLCATGFIQRSGIVSFVPRT